MQQFGKDMLQLFGMDANYINLNCASVGMEPLHITEKRFHYIREINKQNELWFRFLLNDKLRENTTAIAKYINCDPDEIAFARNATEAFSDVLSAVEWKDNDTIVYMSIAYPAMRHQIKHLSIQRKLNIVEIPITKALLNNFNELLEVCDKVLGEQKTLRMFVYDHISSVPSVLLPVKELTALCRKHNCIAFCDGAQSIGQIPLDLNELKVDYYISNFHKWGYSPRPVAITYIRKDLQEGVHPSIISNHYGKGFQAEFNWKGTGDPSPYLVVIDAIAFRNLLGETKILSYCKYLAKTGGQIFAKTWNTRLLVENTEHTVNLVNIEVPLIENHDDLLEITKKLLLEHNFFLITFAFDGKLYARISANIYNDESDYHHCATVSLKYFQDFTEQKNAKQQ